MVIKKLLQLQPKENKELIQQVAKMTDKVEIPSAKASILWLVGEYCNLVPKIAPDVLRKAAKNFINEVCTHTCVMYSVLPRIFRVVIGF